MTNETVTLIDQSGVELLVSYNVVRNNKFWDGEGPLEVELNSVEVVIAKRGIDILKAMDYRQIQAIEDEVLLEYEKNN